MADGIPKDPRGGPRPNAGRPKGARSKKTILKEKIAEELILQNQIAEDIRMLLPMGIRKKGVAALKELSKEEIEQEVNNRIGHHAHKLINAQLSIALGTQHLYRVKVKTLRNGDVKKEHVLITDPEEIKEYLDNPAKVQGHDYIVITSKAPDNNAINNLMDRLVGKAATKVVGANNADGSEGPIRVVVANFSPDKTLESPATQPLVESIIQDAIDEDDVAQLPPKSTPDIQENTENPENIHGN